jgi:hypothetical protein
LEKGAGMSIPAKRFDYGEAEKRRIERQFDAWAITTPLAVSGPGMSQNLDLEEEDMIERKRLQNRGSIPKPFDVLRDIHHAGVERKAKRKMKGTKKKKK